MNKFILRDMNILIFRKTALRAVVFAVIMQALSVSALFAMGRGDSGSVKVRVSGMVRLVGNQPFSFLVITGETREWIIEEKERHKLTAYQQQTVTVEGAEYYTDLTFAGGAPAGRRYYLKNITVIK